MAVHARYNSLYISSPSSAKQQREMTKFCFVWRIILGSFSIDDGDAENDAL